MPRAELDFLGHCKCKEGWTGTYCEKEIIEEEIDIIYEGECDGRCSECFGPSNGDCTECAVNAEFALYDFCECSPGWKGPT